MKGKQMNNTLRRSFNCTLYAMKSETKRYNKQCIDAEVSMAKCMDEVLMTWIKKNHIKLTEAQDRMGSEDFYCRVKAEFSLRRWSIRQGLRELLQLASASR